MNELEDRLKSNRAQPRRPLSSNFTQETITKLSNGPKWPVRRPKWKEYLLMKLHHKPAIALATLLATVSIGGSAYAVVGGWNGVTALFSSQTNLNDGSRIVKVDTQNCPDINAFNVTQKNRTSHDPFYYKIKSGSPITNQQVVTMVQGACEADAESQINTPLVQQLEAKPENKDKLVAGADSVITQLTNSSVSIRSVVPYASKSGPVNHIIDQTFTRLDPQFTVISNGASGSVKSLKVGDHVVVYYRATGDALTHSETTAPDQVDASAQTLVAVIRVSAPTSAYYDYQKYHGKEFEQVTPCNKTPIGYCTMEEFYSK